MSQSQRELRSAAAKAFSESLDQLQNVVGQPKKDRNSVPSSAPSAELNPSGFNNPAAWEDAVADIEQFMQSLQTEPGQTQDSQP